MTQVAGIQRVEARGEVGQRCQRRGLAGIVEDDALEVLRQVRTAEEVAADHRRQPEPQGATTVVGEQAVALHHHHVEAVVGVGQHMGVVALEQVIEHQAAQAADVRHAHALREALAGIELAQAADAVGGVRQAGAGEAPGTDGGADQGAFTRRPWQPVAEQCQIQSLDAQCLGAARRTRQDADVGRLQALPTNVGEGTASGTQGQGGKFDLDGAHAGLLEAWQRL
ncbi:hypothetical protein D9M69_246490 [compost metagenome]